jgi:hypothetical protein
MAVATFGPFRPVDSEKFFRDIGEPADGGSRRSPEIARAAEVPLR